MRWRGSLGNARLEVVPDELRRTVLIRAVAGVGSCGEVWPDAGAVVIRAFRSALPRSSRWHFGVGPGSLSTGATRRKARAVIDASVLPLLALWLVSFLALLGRGRSRVASLVTGVVIAIPA